MTFNFFFSDWRNRMCCDCPRPPLLPKKILSSFCNFSSTLHLAYFARIQQLVITCHFFIWAIPFYRFKIIVAHFEMHLLTHTMLTYFSFICFYSLWWFNMSEPKECPQNVKVNINSHFQIILSVFLHQQFEHHIWTSPVLSHFILLT